MNSEFKRIRLVVYFYRRFTFIEAKARSQSLSVSLASLVSSVRVAGANWHRQYIYNNNNKESIEVIK